MSHDQGHGPVKVLGAEAGVDITVGLLVTVDHGSPTARSRWTVSWNSACSPWTLPFQAAGRAVVRRVIEHSRFLPEIGAIRITSATFIERAHTLYESLDFRRAPERDWYVPGEDVLLWVFTLEV